MAAHADTLAKLVRETVAALEPGVAVRLWNGERIGPSDGPVVLLNDPAGLARLLLRPRIETVIELWMAKGLDIDGGSLFDVAAARSQKKVRLGDIWRRVDKRLLAKALPALIGLARSGRGAGVEAGTGAGASGSSKAAIQFHYDVSNDFYRLFLDRRMVYSCAYFDGWHDDIDKAQTDKLDMICRKLRLQEGERFLDIGCGWGALLIHAAGTYGVSGHGVTLSQAQYELATARVFEAGLQDRITIELKPFQALTGRFDKIASIGMFEHVGFANHDAYLDAVKTLLRPGGLYLHHAITRPAKTSEAKFHKGTKEYAAILRYIFPGAELDHIGHSSRLLEAHRFEVHDVENWRMHYARTCRLWAERLQANFAEAARIAGEPRARLWLLYLVGVSLGFERGGLLIYQTLASRRRRSGPSEVPPTRRDLYS
ncbi:SAM-dependent methyltransferase [Mangrovicella endophytica]|uniref:SAM-dependent methyltransferase n=1 Tax=Mangrovicella endophytica TaxID=2066697 RepID=UPI000C9DC139|nr:cyclopropane-fatty-acyl-phospholipid synthase family protein [Mangrovicella endophytica]